MLLLSKMAGTVITLQQMSTWNMMLNVKEPSWSEGILGCGANQE